MEQTINHRGVAVAPENKIHRVPILNIPVMSPEREKELAKKQKEKHPDWYADYYERKVQAHED